MKLLDLIKGKKTDKHDAERQRRIATANEFVNVKDVRGSVLHTKDGCLFAFLKIQPISLDLLSPREKDKKIRGFAAEFSAEKKGFKFFSISRPVDISGLSSRLARLLVEATDPAQKDLLNHEIREVSAFALTGEVIERQFYMIIWEHATEDGEKELSRRARELENRFSSCEIVVELCDQGTIIRLCNLFANPNYAHLEDGDVTPTIPMLSKGGRKKRMRNANKEQIQINNALLNTITPMGGLEFMRNKLYIGENVAKVYAVTKYPQSIDPGWLSKISNIPRAVSCQVFEPCDNGALIEHLSRSITQYRGIAESTRDALARQRAEKSADDAERLMQQIDQNGETVGYMSNLVMPVAKDEAALEKICRTLESGIAALRCKIRVLSSMQKEAYQAVSPYHIMSENIRNITRRNVPLSTFMGGMPFASSGYSDRDGYYFAKDAQGGLIVLDPWTRGGDRTNTNFVILGVAGVGKSTAAKSMILSEFMSGTKIICIDPEREVKDLCRNLNGDWINCGGGSGGRINPLEIRPAPVDDEDEAGEKLYSDDGTGMGAMALHFKTFEVFIKLYMPDLTEIQKAVLKQALEELYGEFGITWDTNVSALRPKDFPTFKDLYALLKKRLELAGEKKNLEYLTVIIREIAEGSDSFLWNGHTTVNPKSRFICLDTFDLQNTSDTIKKTQYYNILTWAWEQMSKNRNEKVLLVCDEAYLLVDPNVPQSLIFLRNVAKRARKYEAGICIISHSVVDFLDPAVKMYGQALMDIPAYKILMGCDGKNLAETAELYSLTEVEQDHLFNKKRGYALFFVGSKRLLIRFDIPAYKLRYMGRGGGR